MGGDDRVKVEMVIELCYMLLSRVITLSQRGLLSLQGELSCFVHHRGHYQRLVSLFNCIFVLV